MNRIRVSDGVDASTELLDFVNNVLRKESLTHWPVDIWSCKGEGICGERICFGICDSLLETKGLFLHEVAHAILNPKMSSKMRDWHLDSYWHKTEWVNTFNRLCATYLPELEAEGHAKKFAGEISDSELKRIISNLEKQGVEVE